MKLKKINRYLPYILFVVLFVWHTIAVAQEQRFPRPEFETGYAFPTHQLLNQRGPLWEYLDVTVLILALSAAAWLAIKKRSRQGLVWLSLFSLAYFGFFRQGCICSVGSIQNTSMALFNSNYAIPLTALLFFMVPLIFALLFGRVFCAGVCPLGAIQELTGFRMVQVPKKIEKILTAIPFVYLGLAVLYSATASQFVICRFDPFVGIFRIDAPYTMIIFGALLLLAGIFVNRPYCRYLCPYGVILGIFSRFSVKHLTITPAECRNCTLCESGCPYNVILQSDPPKVVKEAGTAPKISIASYAMVVVLAIAGGVIFYNMAPALSGLNMNVSLAREIRLEKERGIEAVSKAAVAYLESGMTEEELFSEEEAVIGRFRRSSPWVGIFLGLSLGMGLLGRASRKIRTDYVPDRGKCVSCGKCFKYCPVKIKPSI